MNGTTVFVLPVINAVQTKVRVITKQANLYMQVWLKYHVKQKLKDAHIT